MAKDNKFLNLLETYQSRYEQAGFLVGDVFKFNDNFKSHGDYKAMTQDIKDLLDSYIESGLHLRVVAVQHNPEYLILQNVMIKLTLSLKRLLQLSFTTRKKMKKK